jgi:hypothetical protein
VTDCVTASPRRSDGEELLSGYVTFHQPHGPQSQDPRAMDLWFEEDDPVYGTPRDPYHRVDDCSRAIANFEFERSIQRRARRSRP